MAASNKLTVLLQSYGGQVARIALLVAAALVDPSGVTVTAIRSAIATISSAKTTRASISLSGTGNNGTASDGSYESVCDKAEMVFRDDCGGTHRYQVPGPKAAIFKSDSKDVVDASAETVEAFVAAMNEFVTRDSAALDGGFRRGIRRRYSSKQA